MKTPITTAAPPNVTSPNTSNTTTDATEPTKAVKAAASIVRPVDILISALEQLLAEKSSTSNDEDRKGDRKVTKVFDMASGVARALESYTDATAKIIQDGDTQLPEDARTESAKSDGEGEKPSYRWTK